MSKSYGKYKTEGICTGDNTEFYRDRNRRVRTKNKNNIRNLIANGNIEDFDDEFIPSKEPRNFKWNEPTDGTWKRTAKDIKDNKHNESNVYKMKDKNRVKK